MKKVFILTILLLGFVMSPIDSFACGSDVETSCCASGANDGDNSCSSSDEKKSCCAKADESEDGENTCDNSCGENSCHCPNGSINIQSPIIESIELDFNAIENNKQNFYPIQFHVSSGFLSIWAPPKIG